MMKNKVLWICALLMIIGISSCSNDDGVVSSDNDGKNIIGTWLLVSSSGGWAPEVEYEPGEITLTFTGDGKVKVDNRREGYYPFTPGIYNYSFEQIERSIFSGEPETVLLIEGSSSLSNYYSLTYEKDLLHLSEQAYDGMCYTLKKIG